VKTSFSTLFQIRCLPFKRPKIFEYELKLRLTEIRSENFVFHTVSDRMSSTQKAHKFGVKIEIQINRNQK
jgi:hypothetical protein